MSLFNSTTISDGTISHSIVERNPISDPKSYGHVYIAAADSTINPRITTKFDESPKLLTRKLISIVCDVAVDADGTLEPVTVNFTVTAPKAAADADVEEVITFAKAAYAIANFGAQVVDGIA
jgi:hypothetical protein